VQPPSKTKDPWIPCIIKLYGGEEKSYPGTHLSLNNNSGLTIPQHQAIPCQQCHVKSCHEFSYATSLFCAMYIVNKMNCKVEVVGLMGPHPSSVLISQTNPYTPGPFGIILQRGPKSHPKQCGGMLEPSFRTLRWLWYHFIPSIHAFMKGYD